MIIDFPKLHSPFIRETINDLYLVTTKIDEDHKWVFEDKVVWAVDKLDGTNICIRVKDGLITNVFNRTTEKYIFATTMTAWEGACMEGIAKAIQRGWLKDLVKKYPKFDWQRRKQELEYKLIRKNLC